MVDYDTGNIIFKKERKEEMNVSPRAGRSKIYILCAPTENDAAHSFLGRFHLFLDEWIAMIEDYNVGALKKFFGSIFDTILSIPRVTSKWPF